LEGVLEIQLYNEDCLVALSKLPDSSVDLVLTDPPYNISKASWDKIPDYINWCGKWIKECERVLKDNGSFYFWHNDMPLIAQLMEWIRQNTRFIFNSFCIWDKGDFRALSWKNPSQENNLRSWFNTCEYCLYYNKASGVQTERDRTGLEKVKLDPSNFHTLRKYAYDLLNYVGGSTSKWSDFLETGKPSTFSIAARRSIFSEVGGVADHFMRYGSTQWDLCTPETYEKLTELFNLRCWDGYREYEDLRREYEDLRREYEDLRREYEDLRYVHNLDANHNNVWKSKEHNNGKLHVCQKPLDITERIIKTSTKEGATVLDCFMGSGTTGVACVNTRRNFIGIELDEGYYRIAQERIEAAKGLLFNMV